MMRKCLYVICLCNIGIMEPCRFSSSINSVSLGCLLSTITRTQGVHAGREPRTLCCASGFGRFPGMPMLGWHVLGHRDAGGGWTAVTRWGGQEGRGADAMAQA